jgi:LacI family transcriptional regulator
MTGTVGLVTSDLLGRFCTPILVGAENELGSRSHSVLLTNARDDSTLESLHIKKLLSLKVDGLIIVNAETNPRASLGEIGIPVVYAYAPSLDAQDCSVTPDNVDAGRKAVEHLISCGKKKIAIIAGDQSFTATTDRIQGSLAALKDAGLEPAGPIRYGEWDEMWGRAATRLLLDQNIDFDAVVCQSDELARGCIDALKQHDLDIPTDVAVIGHDNWEVLVKNSRPPLTSIDNQLEILGRRAAQLLIDALQGEPHHGIEHLPCSLIQRESTLPLD